MKYVIHCTESDLFGVFKSDFPIGIGRNVLKMISVTFFRFVKQTSFYGGFRIDRIGSLLVKRNGIE